MHESRLILPNGNINTNGKRLVRTNKQLRMFILEHTSFIDGDVLNTYKERVYCILKEINTNTTCNDCDNIVKFVGREYQTFCSLKCANSNKERLKQVKNTNMLKYGGVAPMCSTEIKQKARKTCLTKYGSEYHQTSTTGRKQRETTNIDRYGGKSALCSVEVRNKGADTMQSRYGNTSFNQSLISDESLISLENKRWLAYHHLEQKLPIYKIAEMLQVSTFCVGEYLKKSGITPQRFNQSHIQHDIAQFIQSITEASLLINNRSIIAPYELDIVLPTHNMAIEVNGVYWHGELHNKDASYHINKTNACKECGIRLIHISDVEWINNCDISKSRIRHALGLSNTIYARKCTVKDISQVDSSLFMNENHAQGSVFGSVQLGLFHDNDLVSVMTFGVPRFSNHHQWELLRFATTLNTNVPGGASKLFAYFTKQNNPDSVISYSDVATNTGGVYDKLGFTYIRSTPPNYYYFHTNNPYKLFHRSTFQKHKLERKLDVFDPELTEWENMTNNKYDRIWNCGNDVWEIVK